MLAWLMLLGPFALAQGTYTQIDDPDGLATYPFAINSGGDVVGAYYLGGDHGFLLRDGVYTTIDFEGNNSSLTGINDNGQTVGTAAVAATDVVFLYDITTQSFTPLDVPHTTFAVSGGINNSGDVAGSWYNAKVGQAGFEFDLSVYRIIDPPGKAPATVVGISDAGRVVGYVTGINATNNNFEFFAGQFKPLIIPDAPGATVEGISPNGDAVVGWYQSAPGVESGFLYQNKTVQTLQLPGAAQTFAFGINSAGQVVGYFVNADFIYHGFLWTPPSAPQKGP